MQEQGDLGAGNYGFDHIFIRVRLGALVGLQIEFVHLVLLIKPLRAAHLRKIVGMDAHTCAQISSMGHGCFEKSKQAFTSDMLKRLSPSTIFSAS